MERTLPQEFVVDMGQPKSLMKLIIASLLIAGSTYFSFAAETTAVTSPAARPNIVVTALAGLDLAGMTSGWQKATANAEVGGNVPLTVAGEPYDSGIGTHAASSWKLRLDGKGDEFRAQVGIQDGSPGQVEFIVRGDGRDLFRSGPIKGGDAAKPVRVELTGIQQLELAVDALGDTTSDHANWLEPVIVHHGAPLPPAIPQAPEEPLQADLPGEPANAQATVDWNPSNGLITLSYDGKPLLAGKAQAAGAITMTTVTKRHGQAITQELILRGSGLKLSGTIAASDESLAAETRGAAQKKFPLIRTAIGGPSSNLRNNAIYDRTRDWMLEAPADGSTRIAQPVAAVYDRRSERNAPAQPVAAVYDRRSERDAPAQPVAAVYDRRSERNAPTPPVAAVYDRRSERDAPGIGVDGHRPPLQATPPQASRIFALTCVGDEIRLVFRPRYYQWHKNIRHYRPWTYQVRKDSITGWSSWWAYMRNCSQKDIDSLLAVWRDKQFADYGYRFIQLDDCFQNEFGKGQGRPGYPGANTSYVARGPETWLDWRKDTYPAGINGYAAACKNAGFEPAIWIGSYVTDNAVITQHPDWFIRDTAGKPFVAPWASCGVDATNEQAMNTLVRPTFQGVRKAGISYVKVDLLRHYLYDNLHHNLAYCKARGVTADQMYRKYLGAIRQELGKDTFLLSCWGVLPESVGLADACRIGGDGYGPMTMQQYNSWNGIVWRNDPDHCDVYPHFKPAQAGNVTQTTAVQASPADTLVRPALASIASCMLMLSDRPQVYQNDANLEGLRRSSPVLFSVPGQLYDFTPDRTRNLIQMPRTAITSGANPTPIDALQFGSINPWWLNEYNLPSGRWSVLNRINWSASPVAQATIQLAELGLDPHRPYLAYEFWSHRFLGTCSGSLVVPGLSANGIASIALREKLDHPQLVSTNRHLSQGGAELEGKVGWVNDTLTGISKVIRGDRYELAIHVPAGYMLQAAEFSGKAAQTSLDGSLLRVSCLPTATATVPWSVRFTHE